MINRDDYLLTIPLGLGTGLTCHCLYGAKLSVKELTSLREVPGVEHLLLCLLLLLNVDVRLGGRGHASHLHGRGIWVLSGAHGRPEVLHGSTLEREEKLPNKQPLERNSPLLQQPRLWKERGEDHFPLTIYLLPKKLPFTPHTNINNRLGLSLQKISRFTL